MTASDSAFDAMERRSRTVAALASVGLIVATLTMPALVAVVYVAAWRFIF